MCNITTNINNASTTIQNIYSGKISYCDLKKYKLSGRRSSSTTEAVLLLTESGKLELQIYPHDLEVKKGNSKPNIVDLTNVAYITKSTNELDNKDFTFFCDCVNIDTEMETYFFRTETEKELDGWIGAINYYMVQRINIVKENMFEIEIDKVVQVDKDTTLSGEYYLKVTPEFMEFYMTEELSIGVKFNFTDVADVSILTNTSTLRGGHYFHLRFKNNAAIKSLTMNSKGGELLYKYLKKGITNQHIHINPNIKTQTLPIMSHQRSLSNDDSGNQNLPLTFLSPADTDLSQERSSIVKENLKACKSNASDTKNHELNVMPVCGPNIRTRSLPKIPDLKVTSSELDRYDDDPTPYATFQEAFPTANTAPKLPPRAEPSISTQNKTRNQNDIQPPKLPPREQSITTPKKNTHQIMNQNETIFENKKYVKKSKFRGNSTLPTPKTQDLESLYARVKIKKRYLSKITSLSDDDECLFIEPLINPKKINMIGMPRAYSPRQMDAEDEDMKNGYDKVDAQIHHFQVKV